MSVDPDRFRSLLSRFASGVTVLSLRDAAGRDHGMTVSAFCSVSLEPPLVLACVDRAASMHDLLLASDGPLGVSILSLAQEPLSRHFADADAERWAGVPMVRGESGVPLVAGAIAHLECRIVDRHPAGDHTILIARVERGELGEGGPLVYFRGGYADLQR
ncbi:MAG TPA: flavin reductase family protein [Gemmatimonadaceae bacterium]|nr:flavin reductase family protein [Gemmatimonadaceae bacterium]